MGATPPGHPVLEFTMHPGILKGDWDYGPKVLMHKKSIFWKRSQQSRFQWMVALQQKTSMCDPRIGVELKHKKRIRLKPLCATLPQEETVNSSRVKSFRFALHLRVQRHRMEVYSMPWNHSPGNARVSQIRRPVVKMTHQALRSMRYRVLMPKLTKSPFPLPYTRPSLPPPEQLQLLDLLPWDMLVVV